MDHTTVILTVSETIIRKPIAPRLSSHKTDWNIFREKLESSIILQVPLRTRQQVEDELDLLITNIQQAAWEATPDEDIKTNRNITYPVEVRKLVIEKRKARKKWQNARTSENKTKLNQLSNRLKNFIQEIKRESINRYLMELSPEKDFDYTLWKAMKSIKRPKTQNPPIKKSDGSWAKSNKQKADLFADYLADTFQPYPRQTVEEIIPPVRKHDEREIPLVSVKELNRMIETDLSTRKAPGYDLITGKIIKELPRKGRIKLLNLINASLRLKQVPRQWKVADVILLQKPGKAANEKSSYRPISLLPTMSKLFERLLLKRLKPIIDERNLIPAHQFGFRNKHSTIDQVHRITDIIERALEDGNICSAVFLDVAQAFDKVWHQGLKYKIKRDLPRQYSLILDSYISDRYFRVRYEDEYSDIKEISAGVPQGSVLGPILYLLYTRDVPTSENATTATFADDTAILVVDNTIEGSTNRLQTETDRIIKWTKKWRIKLNETKSTHINFTYKKVNPLPVILNQKVIPYANTAKYLGMTLDAKLKWKEHILKKRKN